jgi:transcriptional regulator with XRE-family HTH domain
VWLNYGIELSPCTIFLTFLEGTMTLDQIKRALKDRNLQAVSRETGLSAATIYRIVNGRNKVQARTIRDLSNYLTGAKP